MFNLVFNHFFAISYIFFSKYTLTYLLTITPPIQMGGSVIMDTETQCEAI